MFGPKALLEFPEFKLFDDTEWPFRGFIQVILKSSSDTHRKALRRAMEDDDSDDPVGDLTHDMSMVALKPGKCTPHLYAYIYRVLPLITFRRRRLGQ